MPKPPIIIAQVAGSGTALAVGRNAALPLNEPLPEAVMLIVWSPAPTARGPDPPNFAPKSEAKVNGCPFKVAEIKLTLERLVFPTVALAVPEVNVVKVKTEVKVPGVVRVSPKKPPKLPSASGVRITVAAPAGAAASIDALAAANKIIFFIMPPCPLPNMRGL
jgi:hypothetical protein